MVLSDNIYLLNAENICKYFNGNPVLNSINFSVKKGEIHGIIGPNGAGKSTLIKIFSGVYKADSGSIFYKGEKLSHNSPHNSLKLGISVVYQELDLIPDLSVSANISLGIEKIRIGLFNSNKHETSIACNNLKKIHAEQINSNSTIKDLSIADQQQVAIAKALANDSKLIILDEPTSALTFKEIENLFKVIKTLKEAGISFIYISHHLNELKDVCDRISILKDGEIVYTEKTEKIEDKIVIKKLSSKHRLDAEKDENRLANCKSIDMIKINGAATGIHEIQTICKDKIKDSILEVKNLNLEGRLKNISFSLNKGETLGVAGFSGSGRTELLETIFGLKKTTCGQIKINGKEIKIRKPKDAIKNGIGMIPENRKESALFLQSSLKENLTFNSLKTFLFSKFFIKQKEQNNKSIRRKNSLNIVSKSINQNISELSGGNQQKTVIGNSFFEKYKIILLDEPTRGIDIQSKNEIYATIKNWQLKGTAFIIVSSEFEELTKLCDKIIILKDGKVIHNLNNDNLSEHDIIKIILGHTFDEIVI